MARFSFPLVQIGALAGAAAMVAVGQWLGAQQEPETLQAGRIDLGVVSAAGPSPGGADPLRPAARAEGDGAGSAGADAAAAAETPPIHSGSSRPRLAVVIDDVGHDLETARALMALPVTLSILPYAEGAPRIAAEARAAGREVFVHLPMEPVGLEDPGPGAITTALTPAEIALRVEAALARVPGAAGLNNHMGSRATREAGAMAAVFAPLSGQDLVFVDSLTHPASLAREAALAAGLTAFDRDVFLDSPGADPAKQLDAALTLAFQTGQVIAIGHPHAATLDALSELEAKADAAGVELVTVGALRAPPTPRRRASASG
ncbi:MAG: divergent polysaccharide deacetylase family protein [Oceanicaulis sp.]